VIIATVISFRSLNSLRKFVGHVLVSTDRRNGTFNQWNYALSVKAEWVVIQRLSQTL